MAAVMSGEVESTYEGGSAVANGADTPVEIIDLNDPQLTSEALDINPVGDAYAAPLKLPDGKWMAKLKQAPINGADKKPAPQGYVARKTKQAPYSLYLACAIECSIIDHSGKFDEVKLIDNWVSTMLNRDGSTAVTTILHKLGKTVQKGPDGRYPSHAALIKMLQDALASEPQIGIESQWEASCAKCDEEAQKAGTRKPRATYGMHRFPTRQVKKTDPATGKEYYATEHDPEIKCPNNPAHGVIIARPKVAGYLALSEMPKQG